MKTRANFPFGNRNDGCGVKQSLLPPVSPCTESPSSRSHSVSLQFQRARRPHRLHHLLSSFPRLRYPLISIRCSEITSAHGERMTFPVLSHSSPKMVLSFNPAGSQRVDEQR